jgi:hypothetical protein
MKATDMTLMADTNMTDEWIKKACERNPIRVLDSGNILLCPTRGSFLNLFERSRPIPPATEGSYGGNLIFPTCADLSVLEKAVIEVLKEKCPDALSPDPKKRVKVKSPFKDQGEMLKYDGYVEGGKFISATSKKNRPVLVDARQQIVTDETLVYPGVWVVCTVRPFWYDKGVNKGVSFGLQSVMLVADDKNLGGGGGGNVAADFAGVNIDAGDVDTTGLFD